MSVHLMVAIMACNDIAPIQDWSSGDMMPAPLPEADDTTSDLGGGHGNSGGSTGDPEDPCEHEAPEGDTETTDPWTPPEEGALDADGDGVGEGLDCDDNDDRVGAELYEATFGANDLYMNNSATLLDPWWYESGYINTAGYGQQAYIGPDERWANTVTYTYLSGEGAWPGCVDCPDPTERYRAGVLARMSHDADQDEGFHGYRCAVAENKGDDCFEPGPHLQIAAFLDVGEDDLSFECDGDCPPNTSFDQLDRTNRDERTDLLVGDTASLAFWVVDNDLVCEMWGKGGDYWRAEAEDDRFTSGGTGLSVLNLAAEYDYLRVCEAFATP